jgi:acetylserotonin N-methyltransferase
VLSHRIGIGFRISFWTPTIRSDLTRNPSKSLTINNPMAKDLTKPDPGVILDLLQAFRWSKTMFAAASLGVFDALTEGPLPLETLAKVLKANADALGRLLDGCVGLQLLDRDDRGYRNTPAAAAYLCRKSPLSVAGYINYSNTVYWKLWERLEDAVREGTNRWKQAFGREADLFANVFHTEEAKREFTLAMHGYGLMTSPTAVASFDLSRFQRFVDVGGATGHLAIAACERYPNMHGVIFELEEIVPLAKEVVGASKVAARIEVLSGDFFTDPLPSGDIYGMGRILHDWPEEKIHHLLTKMYDRLPPGGGVLIMEKLIHEDRRGPVWALMQSLNMLTLMEGKERTLSEYEMLFKRAGFAEIYGCRNATPLDSVLALKAG